MVVDDPPRRAPLELAERKKLGRIVIARCRAHGRILWGRAYAAIVISTAVHTRITHPGVTYRFCGHRARRSIERELGVSWDTIGRALAGRPLNARTRATLRARLSPSAD